ncbi:MAG: flagellar hook-length control protein FliK [Phycisphaeraceae bacterium]|nr:flagellar hook-length control protein FliK [Phycisphaeraceae bacterium]
MASTNESLLSLLASRPAAAVGARQAQRSAAMRQADSSFAESFRQAADASSTPAQNQSAASETAPARKSADRDGSASLSPRGKRLSEKSNAASSRQAAGEPETLPAWRENFVADRPADVTETTPAELDALSPKLDPGSSPGSAPAPGSDPGSDLGSNQESGGPGSSLGSDEGELASAQSSGSTGEADAGSGNALSSTAKTDGSGQAIEGGPDLSATLARAQGGLTLSDLGAAGGDGTEAGGSEKTSQEYFAGAGGLFSASAGDEAAWSSDATDLTAMLKPSVSSTTDQAGAADSAAGQALEIELAEAAQATSSWLAAHGLAMEADQDLNLAQVAASAQAVAEGDSKTAAKTAEAAANPDSAAGTATSAGVLGLFGSDAGVAVKANAAGKNNQTAGLGNSSVAGKGQKAGLAEASVGQVSKSDAAPAVAADWSLFFDADADVSSADAADSGASGKQGSSVASLASLLGSTDKPAPPIAVFATPAWADTSAGTVPNNFGAVNPALSEPASPALLASLTPGGTSAATQGNPISLNDVNSEAEDPAAQLNLSRVTRGLQAALSQKGGAVTLRLSPPELGLVRIQLDLSEGSVRANLMTQHESARQLLVQQLGELRQALQGHGLFVERLGVQTMSSTPMDFQGQPQSNDAGDDGSRSRGEFFQQRQQSSERQTPPGEASDFDSALLNATA